MTTPTPIPDFCVSSNADGFDEFLKVLNEHNGTRWKGRRMFYGIVDNCAWTSQKRWGKELSPQEAIALLTVKPLTESDLIVGNRFECIEEAVFQVLEDNEDYDTIIFYEGEKYDVKEPKTIHCSGHNFSVEDKAKFNKFLNRHFKLLPTTQEESVKLKIETVDKLGWSIHTNENGVVLATCNRDSLVETITQLSTLQQQLKQAKELLRRAVEIRLLTNTDLVKEINQFLTRNK